MVALHAGESKSHLTLNTMPLSSFWQGRRVLLTGHTGFKGSWLLLWLLGLGAEVWGYGLEPKGESSLFSQLFQPGHPHWNWHHSIGDICDKALLSDVVERCQPEVVIHLAAQALVRQSYQEPIETWRTNVLGSLSVLEALKTLNHDCSVVMVTSDKVYENREWQYGYREIDRLGGHDPYSASKASAELAVASWRASFCDSGSRLRVATARAGNVIGGGDWAADRIVPDVMRALARGETIQLRNPYATRPWQHVLEPLSGYLTLAEQLSQWDEPRCEPFNFGPQPNSNRNVQELVEEIFKHWQGEWAFVEEIKAPHEAQLLHLQIDKARTILEWSPFWDFRTTTAKTALWYKRVHFHDSTPLECCLDDLKTYRPATANNLSMF